MAHHSQWPRRSVVEVRRIQMGSLHAFVLTCGHVSLQTIHASHRNPISDYDEYCHCPVCHAEQQRGIEPPPPKISLDYLDTLIEKSLP